MEKVIIFCFGILSFTNGQYRGIDTDRGYDENEQYPRNGYNSQNDPYYNALYGQNTWDRYNHMSVYNTHRDMNQYRPGSSYNPYIEPYDNYYRPPNQYHHEESPNTLHPYYRPYVQYGYQAYGSNLINGGLERNNPQAVSGEQDIHSQTRNGFNENTMKHVKDMVVVDKKITEIIHSVNEVESTVPNHDGEMLKTASGVEFKKTEHKNAIQSKNKPKEEPHYEKHHSSVEHKMCNFMHKHHYDMGDEMMHMACKLYMQWGDNMQHSPKWKPTEHQKSWFDSLASRTPIKKRYRRQADFRQGSSSKALRKEYRMLNDEERYRLHRAMNVLKNTHMDGMSMYDVFVRIHQANVSPGAHFGPAFLPFHRELLLRFENALREIDASVSLPYWDSNLDYILGDDLATESILWSPDFLGNGVGDVTTGPFAYWQVAYPESSRNRRLLFRNLTVAPPFARTMPALMSDEAILHMIESPSMRNLTWFVSPVFESNHGAVHNWVGGVMGDIPLSPSDPVFFMHHTFIDCLWEQSRKEQKKRNPALNVEYDFPNDTEALGLGLEQPDGSILQQLENSYHYALHPMLPFENLRNIDGLSNIYFDQFYSCQPSPICSRRYTNCRSKFLFCDIISERCAPKLVLGTRCEAFNDSEPCYQGYCCDGVCQRSCSNDVTNGSYGPRNRQYGGYSDYSGPYS